MTDNPFAQLPSVTRLIEDARLARFSHEIKVGTIRRVLDAVRGELSSHAGTAVTPDEIVQRVMDEIKCDSQSHYREVINATGIILHTNLGRSVLAPEAIAAATQAAGAFTNLEMDLTTGERSNRQTSIREELKRLTGAESGTAVNNCAAATVITLKALAAGREVIVSRGQLIEIGGSFRIPEIMAASGAILKEVGTTNITRLADYDSAIGPNTAMLMRVHTSNYRIRGFTGDVGLEALVVLGRKHNLPVVDDAGSGMMIDLGFADEPNVITSLKIGADLVLFSGDKLLGGPQSGLIAGVAKWIQKIEKDPLMRAFRLDKMTLAALEATLRLYRDPASVRENIPTLRMLSMPIEVLRARTIAFAERLNAIPRLSVTVLDDVAFVGGGSLPEEELKTVVMAIRHPDFDANALAKTLRGSGVVARIHEETVRLDLRTVFDHQLDALLTACVTVMASVEA